MKTREGTKLQSAGRATTPEIVSGERIGDFVSKIHDGIAHRAYEFFEARGDERGHDLEDWFRAESELLHPVKVKTWQSEQKVYVNAEIPAFRALNPGGSLSWLGRLRSLGLRRGTPSGLLPRCAKGLTFPLRLIPLGCRPDSRTASSGWSCRRFCIDGLLGWKWEVFDFSLDEGHGQKIKRRTHHEHRASRPPRKRCNHPPLSVGRSAS